MRRSTSSKSKSKSHSKKDKPRSSAFLLSLVNKYQVFAPLLCFVGCAHTYVQLLIIEHVTLCFSLSLSLSLFMRICVCICAICVCVSLFVSISVVCLSVCSLSFCLSCCLLSFLFLSFCVSFSLSPLQIQSVRPEDMELLESSTNTSLLDTTASDSPLSEVCVCVCVVVWCVCLYECFPYPF